MRTSILVSALATATLGVMAVPAFAGTSGGNGAQRSALSAASNSSGGCSQGSGSTSDGWAMLNKTGAPVPGTSVVQGEVHIVDRALAGQTLNAYVVQPGSSSCMSATAAIITVNSVGIGNGHLAGPEMNGSYFVAIMSGPNEVLASQAVPLL